MVGTYPPHGPLDLLILCNQVIDWEWFQHHRNILPWGHIMVQGKLLCRDPLDGNLSGQRIVVRRILVPALHPRL